MKHAKVLNGDLLTPVERSGHRIVVINGCIWLVGGYNPNLERAVIRSIRCFSIAESKWLPTVKVKGQSSDTMASHCAQSYGPYIVVHGGSRLPFGTTTRQSLFAFDTRSRKWNHLDQSIADDDCPIGLYGHSMSIIDDVLYLVGGTTGLMYYSNVYAFDLKGPPKWQQLFTEVNFEEATADMLRGIPAGRYRHECITLGKYIFMVGGGTSENCHPLDIIHFFDTKTNQWDFVKVQKDPVANAIPLPRRCLSAVQMGSLLVLQGGTDGRFIFNDIWTIELNPRGTPLDQYDPAVQTLQWSKSGTMSQAAFFHDSAVDEENGTVYTFGGSVDSVPAGLAPQVQLRSNVLSSLDLSPPSLFAIAERAVHDSTYSDKTKTLVKNRQFYKINKPRPA